MPNSAARHTIRRIDLNCDMGESYGAWTMGQDAAVLPWITSANIACGFHAGDFSTMRQTVLAAQASGVAIGAHVSLPDLQGFGRREMRITPDETYGLTLYQLGALAAQRRDELRQQLGRLAGRDGALRLEAPHQPRRDFFEEVGEHARSALDARAPAFGASCRALSQVTAGERT